jgi:hypothetical protein
MVPLLFVDFSSSFLRRCFRLRSAWYHFGASISVQLSTQNIPGAAIDVVLYVNLMIMVDLSVFYLQYQHVLLYL